MLRRFAREGQALAESIPLFSVLIRVWYVFDARWSLTPWLQRENPKAIQRSLLQVLSIIDQQHLESKPILESLAYEHWGMQRHRLLRLVRSIPENDDWLAALEKHQGLVNDHILTALRVGKQTNAMDVTWKELLLNERPIDASSLRLTRNRWLYWPFLALLLLVIGTNIRLLGQDLSLGDASPPWAFQMLVFALDVLSDHIVAIFAVSVVACVLGAVPSFREWIVQCVAVCLPWRRRAQESTSLLRHLSILHADERSLAESLNVLQCCHINSNAKNRLAAIHRDVTNERSDWQSLVKRGILNSDEAIAIERAASVSVRSWILAHLATKRRESLYFRGLIGSLLTQPILTIVFGVLVLWISLAMMGLLNELVYSLAKGER